MKLRLEMSAGEQPLAIFEHDGPALHMGRDPTCELALDIAFEGVSWRHARIDVTPDGLMLHDLGSTNGTYVNDRKIAGPTRLQPGDAIRLGGRGPRLRLAAAEAADATETIPEAAPAAAVLPSAPRPPGPIQPASDPRPTLAGALSPLRAQQVAAVAERRKRRLLLGVCWLAGALAVVAALVFSNWLFRE